MAKSFGINAGRVSFKSVILRALLSKRSIEWRLGGAEWRSHVLRISYHRSSGRTLVFGVLLPGSSLRSLCRAGRRCFFNSGSRNRGGNVPIAVEK